MHDIADHTESIFAAAVALASKEERAAYLNQACAGDPALRRRIEDLLQAHDRAGHLLDRPAPKHGPADETAGFIPAGEQVGDVIAGRYKLLEQIGEGGMGTVWVAEQTQPVRRKVALKLIKAGMDSKTVLSRFEAERQALALMDHPNIAKVLDGGTTGSGRPFFVMEYVKGVPFTKFCDDARLSIAERLALFVPVCQAVQHAHQKGIIHRDLKPSNILICLYDGQPVPKVIDFGLAKAMHQPLTEHTLYTAHGLMMGTPIYMSPEQAEFNNLDVDTRTDVYALGVILYELLTGTTPLEKKRFKEGAWQEMLRLIKDEEPQRPSTRLSGSGSLPSVAAQRRLEPVKLTKLVRGELDWIVMKCLEKDRSRRYETANGLARDIGRYLQDEPVEACPPSTGYRLRKFGRKHRTGLVTAAGLAGMLLLGAVLSTWLAVRATRAEAKALEAEAQARAERADADYQRQVAERREAEARDNEQKARAAEAAAKESDASAKEVLEFVQNNVFAAARPPSKFGLGREVTLRKALDASEPKIAAAFATRPRVEAQLRAVLGATYSQLDERALALVQFERAYTLAKLHYGQDDKFTVDREYGLALEYLFSGVSVEALRLLEPSLARRRQTLGPEHPLTVASLGNLSYAYQLLGRSEDAKKLGTELLQYHVKQGPLTQDADHVVRLSSAYSVAGRIDEAARLLEESLPRLTAKLGPEDPKILLLIRELATDYYELGRTGDALALLQPAYGSAVRTLGQSNWLTLKLMQNLTVDYNRLGRSEDAVRILETALPTLRSELGPANDAISPHVINLSVTYCNLGRYRDGVKLLEETIAAIPEKDRVAYVNFDFILTNLGGCYLRMDDLAGARRVWTQEEHYVRSRAPADSLQLANGLVRLGRTLLDANRFPEAERVLREAFAIRQSKEPNGRGVLFAKVLLGIALAGQKQFADAEPLLATGCSQLEARWQPLRAELKDIVAVAQRRLASLYAQTGNSAKAVEICRRNKELLEKSSRIDPDSLYEAACWYSVSAAVFKADAGSDATHLAAAEADRAMSLLKQAVTAGFKDVAQMKMDKDLDALRGRDEFKKLLVEEEKRGRSSK